MATKANKPQSTGIRYSETRYGFQYGDATVTRLFSDERKGWITIGLDTQKSELQIYVTKTGKVRIHDKNGEWQPPQKGE